MAVEIRKFEAIDNSNLGDKEENIKKIANLKTKELSVVSDSVRVKAELDTLQVRIKKLTKKIRVQQKKLKR